MADFVRVPESDWQDILNAVREKTGGTAPMVSGEVAVEIAGISGGSGGGLAFDMGEFVLDADTASLNVTNGIPHELGEAPDFVLVWTDDFADLSADNPNPYSSPISVGYVWLNGLCGLAQRLTSKASTDFGLFCSMSIGNGGYTVSFNSSTSASYCMNEAYAPTNEKIGLVLLGATSSYKYRAGVTYKYFVSRAWWNVGGVANAE